jgi:hypothetical protein
MLAVGDKVTVLFSECKGFGAEKVGQCGTVTRVEALPELVGLYRVEFPDGTWDYLDREVEKAVSLPWPQEPVPISSAISRRQPSSLR